MLTGQNPRLGLYKPYGPGAVKSGRGEETPPTRHPNERIAPSLVSRTSRPGGSPLGGFRVPGATMHAQAPREAAGCIGSIRSSPLGGLSLEFSILAMARRGWALPVPGAEGWSVRRALQAGATDGLAGVAVAH